MEKEHDLTERIIYQIIQNVRPENRETQKELLMQHFSEEDRQELLAICAGQKLPSLMADIIAKKIFSPAEHPSRLQKLLQFAADDPSIEVQSPTANEGFVQFEGSKKMIFDVPADLSDRRKAYTEFQVSPQEFILMRGELYASDMLLLQYSVPHGTAKSSMDYDHVPGILLVVLMRHSPKEFREFPSDRYIHRFYRHTADSGLSYYPRQQIVYIQLDKCLRQFVENRNGETLQQVNDADAMQLFLSAMADINHKKVLEKADGNAEITAIIQEVRQMSMSAEIQAMLLAEKYAQADFNAAKSYAKREGLEEGRYQAIRNMIKYQIPKETILQDYTPEEYEAAIKHAPIEV